MHKVAIKPTYKGPPFESGGTSIFAGGKPAPAISYLMNAGLLTPDMIVLDFGAGKYARNTKFLKRHGIHTVAVDPFNANGKHNVLDPKDIDLKKFDAVFTSYVLNVVPEYIEDEILKKF
jgi:hypothetical protein